MIKDDHLIFENYVDGITKTKQALGGHIMSIVKHGIPSKEEFIKIRQELHNNVKEIQARGTPATEEEKARAQEIIAKIKNYRSQHPHDPTPLNQEENAETAEQRQERIARKWELNKKRWAKWKTENPEKAKLNAQRKAGIYDNKEENAEDMSKSPFHYDPMHGLASAAHKIRDELRGAANDEARPEHIEKMAEIILGPQSEYASVDHYEKALSGVIELLNHYVVVDMN